MSSNIPPIVENAENDDVFRRFIDGVEDVETLHVEGADAFEFQRLASPDGEA